MNKSSDVSQNSESAALLLERVLEYAAENIGDVVPVIVERYYNECPEGQQAFKHHGFDNHQQVAQDMVDSALHCIIEWVDNTNEIKSLIAETVPHHKSLKMPSQLLTSLLAVTVDVLLSAIPSTDIEARNFLLQVGEELKQEIEMAD